MNLKLSLNTCFVMSAMLMASERVVAQAPCPAGLNYAGRLYATSGPTPGDETKDDHNLSLPEGTKLDHAFKQTGALRSSDGGCTSTLSSGDVPTGLYVIPGGETGNGKCWAVVFPFHATRILEGADFDDNDVPRRFIVTLGLYSTVKSSYVGTSHGGANVTADICYKSR